MNEKNLKKVLLSSVLIILLAALYIVSHSLTEKVGKIVHDKNLEPHKSVTNVMNSQLDEFKKLYFDGISYVQTTSNDSNTTVVNLDINSSNVSIAKSITITKPVIISDVNKSNMLVKTVVDADGNKYIIKGDLNSGSISIKPIRPTVKNDTNITVSTKRIK